MSMTPEQQRAIIAKESQWVDDSFGQLDLSAFPALNELPPEKSRDDGRFARDWRDTALSASASALREFVADPDVEALERVGTEIGHEDFRDEVRQRQGESIAQAFKRKCPDYLATDENTQIMVSTLAANALPLSQQDGDVEDVIAKLQDAGFWTVSNLEACFHALSREGLLQVPLGSTRSLSSSERLKVMRLAQNNRADEAIGEYLRCSLDEEPTLEILTDPAYAAVCSEAVLYVFEVGEASYTPTPDRRNFILRYAAGRPLTLTLLQQGWAACQENEKRHERGELLNSYQRPQPTEPPSERELDALDDSSIENLYHQSLRAFADSFRRSPGVLA